MMESAIHRLPLLIVFSLFVYFGQSSVVSFNQPKLCPNASWNPNAITFADNSTIGTEPAALFINRNNTIFVARRDNGEILIWRNATVNLTTTILAGLINPLSLFVTVDEQILARSGNTNYQVDRWALNGTRLAPTISIYSFCAGLFVDVIDNLYCSQFSYNQVVRRSLLNSLTGLTIVAGTGCPGSTPNMLSGPWGIFVTITFDLYVADSNNDRVQLVRSGATSATTVAGNGSLGTIALSGPTGIVLDADGYLFIADNNNNRIVGEGSGGFRCVAGCSGSSGLAPNQLCYPMTMSFDRDGNLFVMDNVNSRIQMFLLLNNTCDSDQSALSSTVINAVINSSAPLIPSTSTMSNNVSSSNVQSFNQPKLSPNASWNPNAITFANSGTVGAGPNALFINRNNTIFVARYDNGEILIWRNGTGNPTIAILTNLSSPATMFVTSDEQILADNGLISYQVDQWASNGTALASPMSVCSSCTGLFVDTINNLYCSQWQTNQVVRKSLLSLSNELTIVAGTGSAGSAANRLNNPQGIFVTIDLDLYVADCNNDRVQLFRSGETNATTVVGNGSNGTTTLHCPTSIVLDADGYLFIVDSSNHQIIGSGPQGFRCVAGCSGSGAASNQLNIPWAMSFDQDGNIFVTDQNNNRVQQFLLSNNSCVSDSSTVFSIQSSSSSLSDRLTSSLLISSSATSIVNQSCFPPVLTLTPGGSSLAFPLQFRRNEDFTLSSSVEVNCNNSLSIHFQWSIGNCSLSSCGNSIPIDLMLIIGTGHELYIPSRTLPLGLYQLQLIVNMNISSSLRSNQSVFVRILPSGVMPNLLPWGTSMISSGSTVDLQLNPGLYSFDLNEDQFNASDWNYQYYCRIYGMSNFPSLNGSLLSIDDSRVNPLNLSCFNNHSVNGSSLPWRFAGVPQSLKSSLVVLGGSLRANRTYQWMVQIENQRNNFLQGTGFLLLRVEETSSPLIAIG